MTGSTFFEVKQRIVDVTGLVRDTLHLHFGLALMFLVALVFRKSLRSPWPLLAVVFFAALGEFLDRRDNIAESGVWNRHESLKDFCNTIFWPSVLLLLARFSNVLKR